MKNLIGKLKNCFAKFWDMEFWISENGFAGGFIELISNIGFEKVGFWIFTGKKTSESLKDRFHLGKNGYNNREDDLRHRF